MSKKICLLRRKIMPEDVGKDCLMPMFNSDHEYVKKCSYTKSILCSPKKPRNSKHHNLIMAIGRCVSRNLKKDHPLSNAKSYDVVKAIMLDNNIVDLKMNIDGWVRMEPKSIAFENMDEDEFKPVSDLVIETASRMLDITVEEFNENYKEYL